MYSGVFYKRYIHFYSHAREGRDLFELCDKRRISNFYSHAREGRDFGDPGDDNSTETISTHTPARGVTFRYLFFAYAAQIFLLTRPRGA